MNVGVCGPILAAGTLEVAADLNVTITAVATATGYQLLAIAASGPLISALSRIYGKRPQFLIASMFGVVGTIVCCVARTYNTLLAGRILQGFGGVAYESIVISVIGDLYYLHERGLRLAVFNFCFGAINCFTSVISGPITKSLGWHWVFYIAMIFVALQAILVVLFTTETTYVRDAKYDIDVAGEEIFDDMEKIGGSQYIENKGDVSNAENERIVSKRKTYLQSIKPYHGRVSTENPLRLIVRPFAVLLNPAIVWVRALIAFFIIWYRRADYIIDCFSNVNTASLDREYKLLCRSVIWR